MGVESLRPCAPGSVGAGVSQLLREIWVITLEKGGQTCTQVWMVRATSSHSGGLQVGLSERVGDPLWGTVGKQRAEPAGTEVVCSTYRDSCEKSISTEGRTGGLLTDKRGARRPTLRFSLPSQEAPGTHSSLP